jgi:hypothetical protein
MDTRTDLGMPQLCVCIWIQCVVDAALLSCTDDGCGSIAGLVGDLVRTGPKIIVRTRWHGAVGAQGSGPTGKVEVVAASGLRSLHQTLAPFNRTSL